MIGDLKRGVIFVANVLVVELNDIDDSPGDEHSKLLKMIG